MKKISSVKYYSVENYDEATEVKNPQEVMDFISAKFRRGEYHKQHSVSIKKKLIYNDGSESRMIFLRSI